MNTIFRLDKNGLTDKNLVRCFDVDGVLMTYAYGKNGMSTKQFLCNILQI